MYRKKTARTQLALALRRLLTFFIVEGSSPTSLSRAHPNLPLPLPNSPKPNPICLLMAIEAAVEGPHG
jgi:hypothetical protein